MKPRMRELDPRPARALTSREAASLLCSLLGGLCQHTPIAVVREAARWCAERDEVWQGLQAIHDATRAQEGPTS